MYIFLSGIVIFKNYLKRPLIKEDIYYNLNKEALINLIKEKVV